MKHYLRAADPAQAIPHFVREGHVKFTPAQANHIVTEHRYDRQRDETKSLTHIATLTELMRRGMWLEKSPIDFALLDGRYILINGHNRMRAQAQSGVDILWNVTVHECETIEDVRALYHRFDTNLRLRSNENIIQGAGFVDMAGGGKGTARALYAAAPVIAAGLKIQSKDERSALLRNIVDDRLQVAQEYIDEAQKLDSLFSAAKGTLGRKLRQTSVFSVALVTMRARPDEGHAFWGGIAENDGLRRNDPRATLTQYLLEQTAKGRGRMVLFATARAWNAFCANAQLKMIKTISGTTIQVAGTQHMVTA